MVTSMFFFFGVGMFLSIAIKEAAFSIAIGERTYTILSPIVYPLRVVWVIGIILFLLQGVSKFIHDLNIVRTGQDFVAAPPEKEDLR